MQIYRAPRQPDKLAFAAEAPPGEAAYFKHDFGDYQLEGRILYNQNHDAPWVLSIHGARADYTKANPISYGLQTRGVSLLSFNLSGHNEATPIPLESTSLVQNIREAEAFYQYLDRARPVTLIGYSLGANVALELLKAYRDEVDRLILVGPAIYAKAAYNQNFGEPFRTVLTQPFSYRQNDILHVLDDWPGRLLVLKGQYDGLESKVPGTSAGTVTINGQEYYSPIPAEVFAMIERVKIPSARRQLIEVAGCGHSIILWMRDHRTEAERLNNQIAKFIEMP